MDQDQSLLLDLVPTLAVAGVLVSFLPQTLIFFSPFSLLFQVIGMVDKVT
jgi:hypothetical protein